MNRANLPSVFGELLYLLEYRDKEIGLLHRDRFSLPPNLYVIGTMNTADRSIRSVDTALGGDSTSSSAHLGPTSSMPTTAAWGTTPRSWGWPRAYAN